MERERNRRKGSNKDNRTVKPIDGLFSLDSTLLSSFPNGQAGIHGGMRGMRGVRNERCETHKVKREGGGKDRTEQKKKKEKGGPKRTTHHSRAARSTESSSA